jgi:uncharacterized protein (DUF2225 family)
MMFTSLAVRSSAVYTERRESDLHVVYKGISPLHYSIIVCPTCKYAASSNLFSKEMPRALVQQLTTALSLLPAENLAYCEERDLPTVLASFQLAIRSSQLKKAGPGDLAGLILAAAWIARESGDYQMERDYLEQALKYYLQAFEKCSDHIGNLNDVQAIYLIGELHLRTGNYAEAINWFNRVIVHPKIKTNAAIEKMARDQWAMAREMAKNQTGDNPVPVQAELKKEPEKEEEVKSAPPAVQTSSLPRRHTTMKMPVNLYPDQIDWLTQMVNAGYNHSKTLITKEQVVRALIDALMEKLNGRIPESFSGEAELKAQVLALLNS